MNLSKELKDIAKDLTILYAEDDKELRDKVSLSLNMFFKSCIVASDGEEALKYYKKEKIDIVISDIQMPHINGIELTKEILNINKDQTIIIISAYDDSKYLIELINLGISNFITKPIVSDEFIKILYNCSKKLNIQDDNIIILPNNYTWNKNISQLIYENNTIKLTKNETVILKLLILNPQQIFPNEDLYNAIFYEDSEKDLSINSIRLIVKRLRKKLPENIIENVYGKGYKLLDS